MKTSEELRLELRKVAKEKARENKLMFITLFFCAIFVFSLIIGVTFAAFDNQQGAKISAVAAIVIIISGFVVFSLRYKIKPSDKKVDKMFEKIIPEIKKNYYKMIEGRAKNVKMLKDNLSDEIEKFKKKLNDNITKEEAELENLETEVALMEKF